MEIILSEKEQELLIASISKQFNDSYLKAQLINPVQKSDKKLLSVREVAELLHVTTTTIHIWKSQGRISFKKIGRRTLFSKEDILKELTNVKMPSKK